jgi:hypothetical protein
MSIYRTTATVSADGLIELFALPFQPGELVEVTVRPLPIKKGQIQNPSDVKPQSSIRTRAITTIQSGKYVKALNAGERLASDEFAMQKQAESSI